MAAIDLSLCDVVAFADPAGSKSAVKRVGARSAMAVVAAAPLDLIFVLDVWAARTTTDRFIETIFAWNDQWRPRVFGIEANAMQSLFADALRREARFRSQRLPIVDVVQPTHVEKLFRNRAAIQPVINEGRFFVREDAVEARGELASHPMSATVDIVDSIAAAIGLLRRQPREDAETSDLTSLAVHLRRCGLRPSQIEAAIARRRLQHARGELPDAPPRPQSG